MKVLTARDGDLQISDELRSHIAYFEDGRLLVSLSHRFNPHVRGFMGRLKHLGRPYEVVRLRDDQNVVSLALTYHNR